MIKKLNLFLIFLAVASAVRAQTPRDKYELSLPGELLRIHRGDSATVTLQVFKARGFEKAKTFLRMSSELPEGVRVVIMPESGVFDKAAIKILCSEAALPGKTSLVIASEMRHVPRGVVLTFEIL